MPSKKNVVFSYLNLKIAENMTREEAQKIKRDMPPGRFKKIEKLLQPFASLFKKLFKQSFNERNAAIMDVLKKINKTTGIPVAELMATGLILFGGVAPSFADITKEETKIVKVEKRPITQVRKDLEKEFKLPPLILWLVGKMNPEKLNEMGIKKFVDTISKNLKKSLNKEVLKLLDEVSQDQWPELLAGLTIQKIKEFNPDVKVRYEGFVKFHKTTDDAMAKEIAKVVQQSSDIIQKNVEKAMAKKAYERGYLIS